MDTSQLKTFAQSARRTLLEQVAATLGVVLAPDSLARREKPRSVAELEEQIQAHGEAQVIEKVAYIWFNRFCALRFMDVNRYTRMGVVSPLPGQFQPEILAEAKMGHIDTEAVSPAVQQKVFDLLRGTLDSSDAQGEAYRLLIVSVCNFWHQTMPFLFQRIDDYTELLMPEDLLSEHSILQAVRETLVEENCQDVEVIGWLYQFYISEKKDEVFAGLKKRKKITPENIPAATQLFTPHWIVKYLVQNSLGRLWMLNKPGSNLVEQMEYYIQPDSIDEDFLPIEKPEEIRICDPACGSGHMLTYAFDLLYAMYEEEGYAALDIPEKILTHNLYGIEIDERAGELAAFALAMKVRAKNRRFFRKPVKPNICVLEPVQFDKNELKECLARRKQELGIDPKDMSDLLADLNLFTEADNFGSLLRPVSSAAVLEKVLVFLVDPSSLSPKPSMFEQAMLKKVKIALKQALYLSPTYHVVIANPPYMGGQGMNSRLSAWLKDNYDEVKSDLFSAFIVRNTELTLPKGQLGFMTPFVWMFISRYEKLRHFLIDQKTITSLIQLEYSGFDGATVPICTFTLENVHRPNYKGGYVRLSDFRGADQQGPRALEIIQAARKAGK